LKKRKYRQPNGAHKKIFKKEKMPLNMLVKYTPGFMTRHVRSGEFLLSTDFWMKFSLYQGEQILDMFSLDVLEIVRNETKRKLVIVL
jgi:hypothetical protein